MKKIKINEEQLRARCLQPETEFFELGEVVTTQGRGVNAQESFYIYKDNGAKVLAVAHLDSVIMPDENWTFERARLGRNGAKQNYIWNPQLDDRLGVYIILDLLPSLIGEDQYDILLTTDEEIGATTAENFVAPAGKQYNWIFQFDRRGTGVVLYNYQGGDWTPAVSEFLTVQQGSFSDISRLEHLGCKAMNVGTGYHDEHRDMCYMIVEETEAQVRKFLRFYYTYRDVHFPHTKVVTRYGGYSRWDDEVYENDWVKNYGTGGSGWWDASTNTWQTGTKPSSGTINADTIRGKYLTNNSAKLTPSEWVKRPDVTVFTMKLDGHDHKIKMYSDPITGRQAIHCESCGEIEPVESMYWTKLEGFPVCESCYNLNKMPELKAADFLELRNEWGAIEEDGTQWHTPDRLVWIAEGGWIRKSGYSWIRITPRWDQLYGCPTGSVPKAVSCSRCQQPEWQDAAVLKKGAGRKGQDVYYCRWCDAHTGGDTTEDEEDDTAYGYADDDGMRQPDYAGILEKAGRVYDDTLNSLDNILLLPAAGDTQEMEGIDLQEDSYGMMDNTWDQDWHYTVTEDGRSFWVRNGQYIPVVNDPTDGEGAV
jgi:hypothetical protein